MYKISLSSFVTIGFHDFELWRTFHNTSRDLFLLQYQRGEMHFYENASTILSRLEDIFYIILLIITVFLDTLFNLLKQMLSL